MFNPRRSRDELYTQFLEGAPGDAAMLRTMPRNQQVEGRGNAPHGRYFELGTAVAEVADDAVHPAPPAIIDDGGNDHCIAPRRQALFEPEVQVNSPTNAGGSCHPNACEAGKLPPAIARNPVRGN